MRLYRLSIVPMNDQYTFVKEKFFKSLENAQRYAVNHYNEAMHYSEEIAQFSWTPYITNTVPGLSSGDLGWVMYDIDSIETED